MHFNHALDLPLDSGVFRKPWFCKAISDGGVLVGGYEGNFWGSQRKNFLLYYHPNKSVGIAETHCNASVRVYPNPVKNQLQVTGYELQEGNYSIYSVVGQVVMEGTLQNNIINVESLASGMYFITIYSDGQKVMRKFVKE